MCGIAGIYLNNPNDSALPPQDEREAFINGLLMGIESRGRDATGVVAVQRASTSPHLEKADMEASKFVQWRKPLPDDSRIVLCHTRAATKGSPKNLDNNHPVVHKSCFVTHNGHISNDDEVFEEHKLDRLAQVDTEAIPALIDKFGLDKVHLALQELLGGFAIAAIQPEKHPDVLVLAKGRTSPLEYLETEQGVIWASTRYAMQEAWYDVWGKRPAYMEFNSLNEGELLYIEDGKVEKFSFEVKKRPVVTTTTSGYTGATWRSGYQVPSTYVRQYHDEHLHRRICKCGESQWLHAGKDLKGFCIRTDCRCSSFTQSRYMGKREWRKTKEYKVIAAEKKAAADYARKKKAQSATTERTEEDGPLRLLYQNGTRKTYHGETLVKVEFKCNGCMEYKNPEGKANMGGYALCIDCWGDECTGCMDFFDPTTLTEVQIDGEDKTWFLCPECYDLANTGTVDEEAAACGVIIPLGLAKGKIDGLTVDNMAIKLAAEDLECKAAFLYELLFELSEEEINAETWLGNAYVVSKAKYQECLRDLREGLPGATSKALALPDEAHEPRSVAEAIKKRGYARASSNEELVG